MRKDALLSTKHCLEAKQCDCLMLFFKKKE